MASRSVWRLFQTIAAISLLGGSAGRRDDLAPRRVVEGAVVAAGGPVAGARLFFGPDDPTSRLFDGAAATTDARGRYRADLSGVQGAEAAVRMTVLAHGFRPGTAVVPAAAGPTPVEVRLDPQPWRETRVRLEDESGRPVAGVAVRRDFSGQEVGTRTETDAQGWCRVAMAPGMPLRLTAEPSGARPIELFLSGSDDEPASVTLPVLKPIRGRVVGPLGRPVPRVAVGSRLDFEADGGCQDDSFPGGERTVTDARGEFKLLLKASFYSSDMLDRAWPARPRPLVFADPASRRFAWRVLDVCRPVEPLEVPLEPCRAVRMPIQRASLVSGAGLTLGVSIDAPSLPGFEPEWVVGQDASPALRAEAPVVGLLLPEGSYRVRLSYSRREPYERLREAEWDLVVPPGEGPIDLPAVTLEPPHFQRMAGAPAPELEATDLDTGRAVRLGDFRGKVVVLDFWGFWCGPCIARMPRLMSLQAELAGRPVVFLALHDASITSRDQYDRKIAATRRQIWGGRDLTLRVLLDRPDPDRPATRSATGRGATIRRYGVQQFPTLLVIDHEGKLVENVPLRQQHDRLASLVRKLLEKAEPPPVRPRGGD